MIACHIVAIVVAVASMIVFYMNMFPKDILRIRLFLGRATLGVVCRKIRLEPQMFLKLCFAFGDCFCMSLVITQSHM